MEVTRSKLISLGIAALYIVISLASLGTLGGFVCTVGVLPPLVLIWFADELGSYTGGTRGRPIDTESPAWAIAGLSWMFLVGGPVVLMWLTSRV
jgi:hypothetical protein